MTVVMTRLKSANALPEAEGVAVDMETTAGRLQIRFTYGDAAALVAALQALLPATAHAAERLETAIDPVNQDAVIRASLADGTTQETRIPRSELPGIIRFLERASGRFEAGAEMRQ